jgi:hypothetical protein
MRGITPGLSVILAIGLLAGSAVGVAAQDQADPLAAAWVTGAITFAASCDDATIAIEDDVRQERGHRCEPRTVTSSDPRLSGTSVTVWNKDVHSAGTIRSQTEAIRGDGRGWVCHAPAVLDESASFFAEPIQGSVAFTCTGDGANEGLMALLIYTTKGGQHDLEGLIFPGDLPPLPEVAAE